MPGKIGRPERGSKRSLFDSVWSAGTMVCSAIKKRTPILYNMPIFLRKGKHFLFLNKAHVRFTGTAVFRRSKGEIDICRIVF